MEIFGMRINFSVHEFVLAYKEQEKLYDMENVRENMGTYLTAEHYVKLKGNKSFIEEAAFLLRTYLDKNNMTYEYAIAEAIKDAAESVKIEEERQDD